MDFMEIARQRHTVRKYAPMPVEPEKLEQVLEAGRWAPTAVNAQPQRILVLDTKENLEKVREFCTSAGRSSMRIWPRRATRRITAPACFITARRWSC